MPPPTREGKEGRRLNSQILARGLRALPMTNDSVGSLGWEENTGAIMFRSRPRRGKIRGARGQEGTGRNGLVRGWIR